MRARLGPRGPEPKGVRLELGPGSLESWDSGYLAESPIHSEVPKVRSLISDKDLRPEVKYP